jgi:pimeloyl-ACP methyl ester carboxylesterase
MASARADVLVLVHGWAANAETWRHSGVMAQLQQYGWQDGGLVPMINNGIGPGREHRNRFYRANLPAQAPMLVQAGHLHAQLSLIQSRHTDEKIIIAAHSAGGVVARLALVRPDAVQIDKLITIATPHLGSHRAVQGLEVADAKPFFCPGPGVDLLKSVVGGDDYRYVRDSRAALIDLVPATYGSMLDWLNRQPHPQIEYHSIVKHAPGYNGDGIVPAFSQDMNQVAVLNGRASVHMSNSTHALNPYDGQLLLMILGNES